MATAGKNPVLSCLSYGRIFSYGFGVRLALGADRRNIMRLVLRQGPALALTGAVVGVAAALPVSQAMAGILYGVKPTDLTTFAGGAGLLLSVAVIACLVPAWRATGVDPMLALHDV